MIVDKKDIGNFLPQKDPIVMVDTIIENGEDSVITGFTPLIDNIFSEKGVFTEPGLVENMAQSAAAKSGLESKNEGLKPMVGFIGALKKLKIYYLPKINEPFTTHLKITAEVLNIKLAHIYILQNNQRVAECEMKIFLQEKN